MLLLRSALWTVLLPGMIAVYVPWRYFGVRIDNLAHPLTLVGLFIFALGAILLLLCIVEFARRGKGTLSPLDPPTTLVVTGLYRWVRNPMYVGVALMLVGEIVISRSSELALLGLGFFVAANIFIRAYEEPYLAHRFGASYAEYRKHVGRWIPRLTPWSAEP